MHGHTNIKFTSESKSSSARWEILCLLRNPLVHYRLHSSRPFVLFGVCWECTLYLNLRFSIQWILCVPPGLTFRNSNFCPHSLFTHFAWISEQTAITSLYTINWLVFIKETESVYCAVRAKLLNKSRLIYVFTGLKLIFSKKTGLCKHTPQLRILFVEIITPNTFLST